VKTQKRPHVVPSKLDWISDEVGLCWKEVVGLEASQMPDSLQLILTSIIAFFYPAVVFLHSLGRKRPFVLKYNVPLILLACAWRSSLARNPK
jgi:hypothetical protein